MVMDRADSRSFACRESNHQHKSEWAADQPRTDASKRHTAAKQSLPLQVLPGSPEPQPQLQAQLDLLDQTASQRLGRCQQGLERHPSCRPCHDRRWYLASSGCRQPQVNFLKKSKEVARNLAPRLHTVHGCKHIPVQVLQAGLSTGAQRLHSLLEPQLANFLLSPLTNTEEQAHGPDLKTTKPPAHSNFSNHNCRVFLGRHRGKQLDVPCSRSCTASCTAGLASGVQWRKFSRAGGIAHVVESSS